MEIFFNIEVYKEQTLYLTLKKLQYLSSISFNLKIPLLIVLKVKQDVCVKSHKHNQRKSKDDQEHKAEVTLLC